MNEQTLNLLLVLAVAAGLWWWLSTSPADVFLDPLTLAPDRVALSLQEQVEQGRTLAPQFEAEMGGSVHGAMQRRVDSIGRALVATLRRLEAAQTAPNPRWTIHPFRFQVLGAEAINAFALPDGSVYITRGLLDRLAADDAVAAVLAHEIGHVVLRHTARAFESAAKGNLLLWVFGNAVGNDLAGDLAGVANALFQLGFSREQESQADAFGHVLACASPYGAGGFASVFELFERLSDSGEIEILSTHPLAGRRLEPLQALACRFPLAHALQN